MMLSFKLKHGDCEWLSVDRGESDLLHITNLSSEEVKIYLGDEDQPSFFETCISPYGSFKKHKGDFSQPNLCIRVEGHDNRKYIVGVEY